MAADAVVIDSTGLTVDQVLAAMEQAVAARVAAVGQG
jgi:hypothetical protein